METDTSFASAIIDDELQSRSFTTLLFRANFQAPFFLVKKITSTLKLFRIEKRGKTGNI